MVFAREAAVGCANDGSRVELPGELAGERGERLPGERLPWSEASLLPAGLRPSRGVDRGEDRGDAKSLRDRKPPPTTFAGAVVALLRLPFFSVRSLSTGTISTGSATNAPSRERPERKLAFDRVFFEAADVRLPTPASAERGESGAFGTMDSVSSSSFDKGA